MSQFIIIQTTFTERKTYVGGVSQREHEANVADGFTYDRLARQYRKSTTTERVVSAEHDNSVAA